MAPRSAADELRRRADRLRRAASRIEDGETHGLAALAGDDTWRGPTASAFVDDLRVASGRLVRAHDELLRAARRLDAAADDAERAAHAALVAPVAGPR